MEEIVFSRSLLQTIEEPVERRWLHGFGDASKQAYCAVIYLVQQQFSGTYAQLITSKTRVAPIKPKSIPRLELMPGRILAALMDTVQKAINVEIHSTHLWLDSYTALCWIANHQEWKQFVKARVNEILSLTTENQWRHCPSEDNPADIGSRGMNAIELEKLWWNGPEWITKSPDQWPADIVKQTTEESEAERLVTLSATQNIEDEYKLQMVLDPGRYSSEKKLFRVTAWIIRFVGIARLKIR